MKNRLAKKKNKAVTLIKDLQNTWSQFDSIKSKNNPNELQTHNKGEIAELKKKDQGIKPEASHKAPKRPSHGKDSKTTLTTHYLGQGLNFYNKGKYKKAIDCFQLVLDKDPNSIEGKEYLTKAQQKFTKDMEEPKKFIQDMITQEPISPNPTMNPETTIEKNRKAMKSTMRMKKDLMEGDLGSLFADKVNTETIIEEMEKNGYFQNDSKFRPSNKNELGQYSTTYLVNDETRNNLGIDGIISEIAKRKKAEERLRILSTAIEQSSEGIVVSNLEGNLLFVNDAFANMHGYKPEKIVGKNISNLQKNESKQNTDLDSDQSDNSTDYQGERLHVKSDGSLFPTYTNTSVFRDEYGNPIGMIGTHRDITMIKKAEEEIRKLGSAVEQSIDGVAICDIDSKLTYVNEAFGKMHGYSPNEMIGMDVEQLYDKTHLDTFRKGIDVVKDKGSWMGECGQNKKNGTFFPSYMSVTLLNKDNGNPSGFLVITRDITKRKKMEEELKKYNTQLEGEVKKRTNELIHSEKMASLGQLVSGIAQEINNPLGYVSANTEIIEELIISLKENSKDKKILQLIQDIEDLVHTNIKGMFRIAKTTKSLERFVIPYKGEMVPSNINDGIKDTLLILSNQIKQRIKIHEDYGKIPRLICNLGHLNQAFMNIILNSVESMDKGEIKVKTRSEDENIIIEITDTGKGISDDIIDNVFDPFFTSKEGRAGMGLSISYRIIQSHNGKIKIVSMVGEGTKVTIYLPMV